MNTSRTVALVGLLAVGPVSMASAAPIVFGISDGNYIYHKSPRLTPEAAAGLNAKAIYFSVLWERIEPQQGKWVWDDIDRRVDNCQALGLAVRFRVKTGSHFWGVVDTPAPRRELTSVSQVCLPKDFAAYQNYLRQLVRRYASKGVHEYAVGTEIDDPGQWPHSREDYFRLLEATAPVIRQEDPKARILDHGLTSTALGSSRTQWLLEHGEPAAAVAFYNRYNAALGRKPVADAAELRNVLQRSEFARAAWAILGDGQYFRRVRSSVDLIQLHLYEDADANFEALHWLRDEMTKAGCNLPFAVWESGYHMPKKDLGAQSEAISAGQLVKKYISTMSLGATELFWLTAVEVRDDWPESERLYAKRSFVSLPLVQWDGSKFRRNAVGDAFSYLAGLCTGDVVVKDASTSGVARFDVMAGSQRFSVVWLRAPGDSRTPAALSLKGKLCRYDGRPLASNARVGTEPVLVFSR